LEAIANSELFWLQRAAVHCAPLQKKGARMGEWKNIVSKFLSTGDQRF
jgi:hypothetical protein